MTHYGPNDPYGQPHPPQQPYGPQYTQSGSHTHPAQQPMYGPPAQRRSQGLAITTLVLGVVAAVLALTPLFGVGIVIGVIAAILAIVALVAKSQGGKMFAGAGLALGMVAFPVAVLMYMWGTESAKANLEQQQLMQKCIEEEPENIIECANLD